MRIVTQKTIKFVFSYYVRWQRGTARIRLPHADRAAIDQYTLPTGPTAANPQQQCAAVGWDGGTDRQTDARQLRDPAPHTMREVPTMMRPLRRVRNYVKRSREWWARRGRHKSTRRRTHCKPTSGTAKYVYDSWWTDVCRVWMGVLRSHPMTHILYSYLTLVSVWTPATSVWCRGRSLSCLTLCCTQPASATPGSSYRWYTCRARRNDGRRT